MYIINIETIVGLKCLILEFVTRDVLQFSKNYIQMMEPIAPSSTCFPETSRYHHTTIIANAYKSTWELYKYMLAQTPPPPIPK